MKFSFGLLLVVFISVNIFPTEVRADYNQRASVSAKDTYLLQIINQLLLEVLRLQNLLNEQKSVSEDRVPHTSVLFTNPMEAKYFVEDNRLVPVSGGLVRQVDQDLFTLLSAVLGKEAVNKYVAEWRVFYEEEADTDAFVESTDNPNRFVVSINRFGFDQAKIDSRRSYAELYVHEYAHLLLLGQSDLVKNYTRNFWNQADVNHSRRLEKLNGDGAMGKLSSYYETNQDRFVSDYATLSPDEDLAETFVAFVYTEGKEDNTLRSQKIKTFSQKPDFVSVRYALRNNLNNLNLLVEGI